MHFSLPARLRRLVAAGLVALVATGLAAYWFVFRPHPGDARLNAFVSARPPVPIVFTSRTEPLSFEAAAPEGEEFRSPGKRLWAAREGRLRLLTPRGTVHELTWGKKLPDGGTLIDVMSPSVSLDGKTILFAGRKGGDDHGHFRLYEVRLDGTELRPLTGGPDDSGADALPPMRFAEDGSLMSADARKRIDYDDIDPVEIRAEPRQIVFASSRTPDLGRDHSRRGTTLWLLHADGHKTPATANRNNDRWPWMMASGYVAFSLWSRNREVISADATEVRPFDPAVPSATQPTDSWLGAFLRISSSGHFGMLVKPAVPVWRPRSLGNGQIAFMTTTKDGALTAVQAEPGLIAASPSAAYAPLPRQQGTQLRHAPNRAADGRVLWTATPSPCPPSGVLLSAAPLEIGQSRPAPGAFGIYIASHDWPNQDTAPSAADVKLQLLFDDPELVDSEPVAVYTRKVYDVPLGQTDASRPDTTLMLANGKSYRGPVGTVFATGLYSPVMNDLPGQQTDAGNSPVFVPPPLNSIARLKIYAARRDRFDDPVKPRVAGTWELLLELPAKDTAGGPIPTDSPTVLAGFGADGKVVRWQSAAADSTGKRAEVYAFAGDHYSLTAPGRKHFCVGCHPGHSGMPRTNHRHAEPFTD